MMFIQTDEIDMLYKKMMRELMETKHYCACTGSITWARGRCVGCGGRFWDGYTNCVCTGGTTTARNKRCLRCGGRAFYPDGVSMKKKNQFKLEFDFNIKRTAKFGKSQRLCLIDFYDGTQVLVLKIGGTSVFLKSMETDRMPSPKKTDGYGGTTYMTIPKAPVPPQTIPQFGPINDLYHSFGLGGNEFYNPDDSYPLDREE